MVSIRSLLFGLGVGAGLMYFLDPNSGNRRRSLVRDQFYSLRNKSDDALAAGVQDLRNRVRGLLAEGMAYVSNEPMSDAVIAERIRARLGTVSRHIGGVNVTVQDQVATLQGDVLAADVDKLTMAAGMVRGVKKVEVQLKGHTDPTGIPALSSAREEGSYMEETSLWSPSTRLLAGVGSGLLVLWGAARGGLTGRAMTMGGIALGIRAATNMKVRHALGMGGRGVIDVYQTVQLPASPEQVYRFWSNYENLPRFLSHVKEVRDMGGGRLHWVVSGPAGIPVEWDARITQNVANQVIAWETDSDSVVQHSGEVRFKPGQAGGTQLTVSMRYTPPAGAVGHTLAAILGGDPKTTMKEDLGRLKTLIDTKEIAGRSTGQQRREPIPTTGAGQSQHTQGQQGQPGGGQGQQGGSQNRQQGENRGEEKDKGRPSGQGGK